MESMQGPNALQHLLFFGFRQWWDVLKRRPETQDWSRFVSAQFGEWADQLMGKKRSPAGERGSRERAASWRDSGDTGLDERSCQERPIRPSRLVHIGTGAEGPRGLGMAYRVPPWTGPTPLIS